MLFNSLSFLVFFPTVLIVYYSIPQRLRPLLLLLASCIFYMAFVPKYILILFFLITLDYVLGIQLVRYRGRARFIFLWISIAANLGVLFFFKYFNFFNANVAAIAHFLHWNYSYSILAVALPLGLSFHVFQSLSYIIEVYRGKFPAERNYFLFALYVMFFPQLVAGPIERPSHLLPQFRLSHPFEKENLVIGLERMAWGFFKKLVIADNIAPIVNHLFARASLSGPEVLLVSVLFAYQLYCDFSGYSDIAVGTARTLGYEIMENFDRPYASRSIAEFWRRWHISLSSWLRDYLYYPLALGGQKHSALRLYASLFVTFVLIGLWHGANWTYVMMGALHGFYLVFGSITKEAREHIAYFLGIARVKWLYHMWQTVITFSLVALSWIFFRADTISHAFSIIANVGNGLQHILDVFYIRYELLTAANLGVSKAMLLIIFIAILVMEVVQYLNAHFRSRYVLSIESSRLRIVWWYALVFSTLFFGYFGAQPFIYFQF